MRFWVNNDFDSAGVSASSEALPVANLQDQLRTRLWRSTGTDEHVDVDFGEAVICSGLALINHNLSPEATITLSAGSSQGASDLGSWSWDAWEAVFGWGEWDWGDGRTTWGGIIDEAELRTDPIRLCYFTPTAARYWRVSLSDPASTDGYIQVGRMFLCRYYEPLRGVGAPYRFRPVDPSRRSKSLGGQWWSDVRRRYYEATFSFRFLPPEDIWWGMVEMLRRVGVQRDIIVDPWPEAPEAARSRQWWSRLYCRLKSLPKVSMDALGRANVSISVTESL